MASSAAALTSAEHAIVARFPEFRARQSHWETPALTRQREAAFATLQAGGLPNRRVEEWKYTDLRALMQDLMQDLPPFAEMTEAMVESAAAARAPLAVGQSTRVLFVNGQSFATLKEDGFSLLSLARGEDLSPALTRILSRPRDYADNAAVALNTAFMRDWIVLHVPAGTTPARPLHLDFRDVGRASFASCPRVLVVVEDGASASVIETHDGPDGVAYYENALIEFDIGAGARVEHVRVNACGDRALALASLGVHLGAESRFSTTAMTIGAAASRQQTFLTFAGAQSQAWLHGATLLRGRQHCDSTLVIRHDAPGCLSREQFRTVLDDESRGVFQGKIVVAREAQKTDGKMSSHAMLLSEAAEMDNKPELEIWADDVVCGHGATAGRLDEELLFYLRARGIPAKEAEAMLIQSFVGEAIEPVANEAVREGLEAMVARWLAARAG